jgi:CheY-like chemotaxis protein
MSIKILLADDSITIQKVVGIIFGGEEYSLTVVDNGKAAVEKARELNPDVLLIDALMPGMSGYEVCEAVRATPSLSTKPILLLTGSFEPFDEDKAKTCGADDFLAKPFESQQIVSKVKELVEKGASRPESAAEQETFIAPPVPEAVEEAAPAGDIWGAFTSPQEANPSEETLEAADATIETVVAPHEEKIGSQWIPVEEETFAFDETVSAELVAPGIEESAYGETDFGAAGAAVEPEAIVAPAVAAAPLALSEAQLREALTSASRDVIERIVWEVVPDLAEVMIKEAIRKIREGQ